MRHVNPGFHPGLFSFPPYGRSGSSRRDEQLPPGKKSGCSDFPSRLETVCVPALRDGGIDEAFEPRVSPWAIFVSSLREEREQRSPLTDQQPRVSSWAIFVSSLREEREQPAR